MDRRDLLGLAAVASGGGALTLGSVSPASAANGAANGTTQTVRGHLPHGSPDFVYLPVRVPPGTNQISVSYTYDRAPGNALDIGVFDERGTALGGEGFRGWSGGFRDRFTISGAEATPGYLPGPVNPGTWHIALGPYTVAPQGMDYEVTVELGRGEQGETPEPTFPPERAKGRGRDWYRGDCHLHTVHSDGKRTPADVAAAARAAGLDFLVTTEHNTTSGHGAWAGLWGDDLLVLTGEEVTTRNGHYLALGTDPGVFFDWRYRARDDAYDRYVRRIHRAGGLVVPAHPNCPFVGCQWKFEYEGADAVEVWNGPWTADDEIAVGTWDNMLTARPGRWLPAMGNSDAHKEGQDVGLPQTVVLAGDLSREALLEGIRTGRSYIAESSKISLRLTASGARGEHADIGGRLPSRGGGKARVTVRLEVAGAPEGATYRLMTDEGEMRAGPLTGGPVVWETTAAVASYVRAEVRRPRAPGTPDGVPGAMAAMTNPVWLDGPGG
ncbi:CehA/McbA family metallohydrolase [Streptomyces sp. ODS28]|uniref:CehA/McbA family metallohydrolase n=1 Tax=Streptomyces sp. ODS28 TaxID=3136688 RepID=UPI0031EE027B